MALAPLAHVLFTRIMHYDASAPDWPDRDRFVLSAGHASMLLYSMLYLTGFGLELDDLEQFRQWGSTHARATPSTATRRASRSRPARSARASPTASASRSPRRTCARASAPEVTDHHVFAICSDGDFEEGVSHEAASLAGHLGLGRLVYVYDDNHITIDGPTELAYTDDVPKRFEAYGWHVVELGEVANDLDALEAGLRDGHGRGGPPEPRRAAQPHRLAVAEVHRHRRRRTATRSAPTRSRAVKEILGLPRRGLLGARRRARVLPRGRRARPRRARRVGAARDASCRASEPGLRRRVRRVPRTARAAPAGRRSSRRGTPGEQVATRVGVLGTVLDAIIDVVPGLVGGGADLTGNTGTRARRARRSIDTARLRRPPDPLRHPRARHGLDHERDVGQRARCRSAARSSSSPTTCGRAARLAALSGLQGRVRLVARLGRRSARTARRTSRSSSSRRCARCPACA